MTKKQAFKNVIPRLDRGIHGFFNLNTKVKNVIARSERQGYISAKAEMYPFLTGKNYA
jgi:hypothetical protein